MSEEVRVRHMRLMVFFDLPTDTDKQRKEYRLFRKYLLKEGYLMIQESVYAKLVLNENAASAAIARLCKKRPPEGLVQVLKVTERQFETMVYVTGDRPSYDEVDSTEGLLVL
ncbi:CRISPR-associated endonuclease Cas2 [Slackia exigua]|uniref:CRISPR-associated endonuclease Cas2 n=1 Tax=Slackia exigua TaxID=84109 RepID=UPI002003CE1F|nr:CRISPR-associated endonuclease Cas2 [Slackia exigua]MCK6139777.1 CRISPR-associated endonuclease Cas2 [Slackia exigua]